MRKADSLLLFAATTLALSVSACNSDSNGGGGSLGTGTQLDATTGQTTSPVEAGTISEGGATNSGNTGSTPDGSMATPDADATDAGSATDSAADGAANDGGDGAVAMGGADGDFDMCYAKLKPACVSKEMNTAELMQVPCKALTTLPLPLTDGGTVPSVTIQAGPYGGKIDWNQGKGTPFAYKVNADDEASCFELLPGTGLGIIDSFGEPAAVSAEIKNLRDRDSTLYTIFRPACFKKGEKYPVITWANGTCGQIAGYSALLSSVASYGFVVIAPNSTWTNTDPTKKVMLRALDYAKALNEDPTSIYYQKLDMDKVGAMGHSQGAAATKDADGDPRVKAVIFWNSQNSDNKPFLNVSGERDINDVGASGMMSGANAAKQPGAWVYFHQVPVTGGLFTGHLTLMEQPERVIDLAVNWWKWQLKGDEEAKKMFVGPNCGFCNKKTDFDYGTNSLLK